MLALEEVERYVKNLTWVEKLKIAWLTFSGQMLSPDIENPLVAARTKLELESARDKELERQMTALELKIYKLIQNKEVENRVSTSHLYFLRRALA